LLLYSLLISVSSFEFQVSDFKVSKFLLTRKYNKYTTCERETLEL
jgi:hypothetical protein